LSELLQLNGFNLDTIIYPGDEIIIRAGVPLTPTPSPTETPTALPATDTPTVTATNDEDTPTPRAIISPQPTLSPTTQSTPALFPTLTGREQLVIGVAVMALLVFLAVIASSVIERKKGNSP
jgi:carbohydrate-binding DOMON domain-containing protein